LVITSKATLELKPIHGEEEDECPKTDIPNEVWGMICGLGRVVEAAIALRERWDVVAPGLGTEAQALVDALKSCRPQTSAKEEVAWLNADRTRRVIAKVDQGVVGYCTQRRRASSSDWDTLDDEDEGAASIYREALGSVLGARRRGY